MPQIFGMLTQCTITSELALSDLMPQRTACEAKKADSMTTRQMTIGLKIKKHYLEETTILCALHRQKCLLPFLINTHCLRLLIGMLLGLLPESKLP